VKPNVTVGVGWISADAIDPHRNDAARFVAGLKYRAYQIGRG
jgi:hypothetical protein